MGPKRVFAKSHLLAIDPCTSAAIAPSINPATTASVDPAATTSTPSVDPPTASVAPAVDPGPSIDLRQKCQPGTPTNDRRNCRTRPLPHALEKKSPVQ
jgi:hypothetical protein